MTGALYPGPGLPSNQDWRTNFSQGIFGQLIPSEYDNATSIAKAISGALGNQDLTMVGHSLGGGLADAAAFATGRPAITFNAAGTSPFTEWQNNAKGYSSTMVNYTVRGEALTTLQDYVPIMSRSPGANLVLNPSADASPITLHGIDAVLKALEIGPD